ncbi:MAG: ATP-dependent RecD-like DNA helicase [Lachnospiraceae bacterium]|nr:ATP-dependent RecD-like DNA helicase [Lachnospiraceae bacterium]MDY5741748.1 ATP-dependent RecD-like DNA helicase [Lachnospiraceae bacterium]
MIEQEGYIDHIIYRNEENGYQVAVLLTDEDEEVTIVGILDSLAEGERIRVIGELTEHAVYGEQLAVSSFRVLLPKDCMAIERYLAAGVIKGIGETLASRIVREFGEDTFRVMEEEPERLAVIKGISHNKALEIGSAVAQKKDMREAMLFLQEHGISPLLARKIYENYGRKLYEILQENPYQLAEDINGIGFKIADEIAAKMGFLSDSGYRIRCGILYQLGQAVAEGHTYLPESILTLYTARLLGTPDAAVEEMYSELAIERKIVIRRQEDDSRIYLNHFYYMELKAAALLKDLYQKNELSSEDVFDLTEGGLDCAAEVKKQDDSHLNEEQQLAIRTALSHTVSIVTGGPGTGKTTTINRMISTFLEENKQILLGAPTGRAAKRMSEATGFEAKTIHRLLEVIGISDEVKQQYFDRNEENHLEADVVIIDEVSMMDLSLFLALLKAIEPGTTLVLVGDVNQLPSVGAGNVLRDMIECDCFPVTRLTRIYRQADGSDIIANAHKILQDMPLSLDNKSKDFFLLPRQQAEEVQQELIRVMQGTLHQYAGCEPGEVQLLSPMRKGPLGVEQLNDLLQRVLNPPTYGKQEYRKGGRLFREGDKIIQVKNNYQLAWELRGQKGYVIEEGCGVFNGDIGIIRKINDLSETVEILFDDGHLVTYDYKSMDEVELAYAITIHKSQGSEYPAVVLPLLSGPEVLMNKNLLYTAITRARNCVVIVGSAACVQRMIDNKKEHKRYSSLDLSIRSIMDIRDIHDSSGCSEGE